jgi:hypothetical protein
MDEDVIRQPTLVDLLMENDDCPLTALNNVLNFFLSQSVNF